MKKSVDSLTEKTKDFLEPFHSKPNKISDFLEEMSWFLFCSSFYENIIPLDIGQTEIDRGYEQWKTDG